MRNVSVLEIPYETIVELKQSLDRALLLPDGVRIYAVDEDICRMVYRVALISDEPVEGLTFPTEPYCYAMTLAHEVIYNKYIKPLHIPNRA